MVNSVVLCGRLVGEPEHRVTTSGTSVASFRIAVDDSRKSPTGEKLTVFLNVSIFGKSADTVQKFVHKGDMIGVIGRLTQRKYNRRSDNVEMTVTEVVADRVELMEPKAGARNDADSGFVADEPAPAPQSQVAEQNLDSIDIAEEDLPF